MLPCLLTKEVCSNTNRKCKECSLDECKGIINMIEEIRKYEDKEKLRILRTRLPEQCKGCSFLEVTNLYEEKVYCPYLIKDECLVACVNNRKKGG